MYKGVRGESDKAVAEIMMQPSSLALLFAVNEIAKWAAFSVSESGCA